MPKRTPQPDEIDLHGLRHKPALALVRKTLAQRENQQGSFSLTIITGNSRRNLLYLLCPFLELRSNYR